MTVRAVLDAGHPVYAGMRNTATRGEPATADAGRYAREPSVDLCVVELDVSGQTSVDSPIVRILQEAGPARRRRPQRRAHGAGPPEAFTTEQLAQVDDTNVQSTQRGRDTTWLPETVDASSDQYRKRVRMYRVAPRTLTPRRLCRSEDRGVVMEG
jgi:hypothetical protein